MKRYLSILITLSLAGSCLAEEFITQRVTPESWERLIPGGQFKDRILPAPIHGALESDAWGADAVLPRDVQNGIEDPEWSYWGGKTVLGPDNKYHWFGCRWPEGNPKGHMGWPYSVMVRAISDSPMGPFVVKEEIAKGHFPEITQLPNGKWALFHFEGYYLSNSLEGPWTAVTKEEAGFPGIQMGSVIVREDDSLLLVDRISNIWLKEKGTDKFVKMSKERAIPRHMKGNYEDPVLWRTEVQYHMLVNDWRGRIAYHMRSKDGIEWKTDPGVAYTIGMDEYEDGTKVDWYKYERPKVFVDEYGRPTHIYFAVIDVAKLDDKPNDKHSSKNIVLPLIVERRLMLLNQDKITNNTKRIGILVRAEEGFNPNTDMDIESLSFGSSEEVGLGGGCKVIKTKKKGKDMILIFSGKDHGFTDEHFAGKLLGKTSSGELLFGYVRLPE